MTIRISTVLGALACASLVACSTLATLGTDENTALNELRAAHETRDQAIASRDVAALSKQHAADLTVRLADGTKLDRAGYEALLLQKADVVAPSRITKLAQDETGYIAVVTPGLQGQGSAVRETWKRTRDGWKLKRVEEVSQEAPIASKKAQKRAS